MRILNIAVIVVISVLPCRAQDNSPAPSVKLTQIMSPEEIKGMGLNKLSATERGKLEVWLVHFAQFVAKASSNTPNAEGGQTVAESQIDGEFEGWSGTTIFPLLNGQIWQQARYAYVYCYAFRPRVIVVKDGGVYLMKVDGISESLPVKRLK